MSVWPREDAMFALQTSPSTHTELSSVRAIAVALFARLTGFNLGPAVQNDSPESATEKAVVSCLLHYAQRSDLAQLEMSLWRCALAYGQLLPFHTDSEPNFTLWAEEAAPRALRALRACGSSDYEVTTKTFRVWREGLAKLRWPCHLYNMLVGSSEQVDSLTVPLESGVAVPPAEEAESARWPAELKMDTLFVKGAALPDACRDSAVLVMLHSAKTATVVFSTGSTQIAPLAHLVQAGSNLPLIRSLFPSVRLHDTLTLRHGGKKYRLPATLYHVPHEDAGDRDVDVRGSTLYVDGAPFCAFRGAIRGGQACVELRTPAEHSSLPVTLGVYNSLLLQLVAPWEVRSHMIRAGVPESVMHPAPREAYDATSLSLPRCPAPVAAFLEERTGLNGWDLVSFTADGMPSILLIDRARSDARAVFVALVLQEDEEDGVVRVVKELNLRLKLNHVGPEASLLDVVEHGSPQDKAAGHTVHTILSYILTS